MLQTTLIGTFFLFSTALAEDSGDSGKDTSTAERLDSAPYLVDVESDDGWWSETLDFTGFSSKETLVIFMDASEDSSYASLRLTDDDEVVAKSVPYAEYDMEDGPRFVSVLKVNPTIEETVDLDVVLKPSDRARMLLCNEIVTNQNDSGPGSLRQATADVRDGGSVCFDPQVFSTYAPIELTTAILVDKNVSFLGTTANGVTIHGAASERLFTINAGAQVFMNGLMLRYGSDQQGGLIKSSGTLSMRECGLTDGSAEYGGAIYAGGTISLVDSRVSDSAADTSGGGIYCDACALSIERSDITWNTAVLGGGIYADEGAVSLGDYSEVMNNTAQQGGGLYADGAGSTPHVIDTGSFTTNTAQEDGGGVYLNGGTLELHADPQISGGPGAIDGNIAINGGGVFVRQGQLSVYGNATIRYNASQGDGGGVYSQGLVTVGDSASIYNNNTKGSGGGIYNLQDVELTDSARIEQNSASNVGGGIYNNGEVQVSDITVRITNNWATNSGGGVFNDDAGSITHTGSEVVNNTPNNIVSTP